MMMDDYGGKNRKTFHSLNISLNFALFLLFWNPGWVLPLKDSEKLGKSNNIEVKIPLCLPNVLTFDASFSKMFIGNHY